MLKKICMFLSVIVSCVCLLQESYADIIECKNWGTIESDSPDIEIFARATNAIACARDAGFSSLVGIDCDGILSRGSGGGSLTDGIVPTFLSLLIDNEIPFFCMTAISSFKRDFKEQHFEAMGILSYFRQQFSPLFIRKYDWADNCKTYFVDTKNSIVFTFKDPLKLALSKGEVFEKLITDNFILKPAFFIFIDDCLGNLGSIQNVCDQLQICFLGIHCTAYSAG
jgi:hypothetical protein